MKVDATRLLPIHHFDDHALFQDEHYVHKPQDPAWQFCVSCGIQPLTDDPEEDLTKYFYAERWMYRSEKWGRCPRCKECKAGRWESGVGRVWAEVCDECEPFCEDEMEGWRKEYKELKRRRDAVLLRPYDDSDEESLHVESESEG